MELWLLRKALIIQLTPHLCLLPADLTLQDSSRPTAVVALIPPCELPLLPSVRVKLKQTSQVRPWLPPDSYTVPLW